MPPTRLLPRRAVTVANLGLAAVLLIALGAIVVPATAGRLTDGLERRARSDCNRIGNALLQYIADTRTYPCGYEGVGSYAWLVGPGAETEVLSMGQQPVGRLKWFVERNLMGGGDRWGGPYIDELGPDPWGRRYVVSVQAWWPRKKGEERGLATGVWVLSAGPDGVVTTLPSDPSLAGDDIGIRIE